MRIIYTDGSVLEVGYIEFMGNKLLCDYVYEVDIDDIDHIEEDEDDED